MIEMHDLVAPYALDALDAGEKERFEAHLVTCAACRTELNQLREGATMLAETSAVAPPPHIKDVVMAAATAASDVEISRASRFQWAWTITTVAAALAAVFFGLWTATTSRLDAAERIAAVYEASDATVIDLDGSHGPARLVFSPSLGQAVFNGANLADLDETDLYEMWLIDARGATSAGTLLPGESVLVHGVMAGLTFAVTVEEAPGVDQSQNDPVLISEI